MKHERKIITVFGRVHKRHIITPEGETYYIGPCAHLNYTFFNLQWLEELQIYKVCNYLRGMGLTQS